MLSGVQEIKVLVFFLSCLKSGKVQEIKVVKFRK